MAILQECILAKGNLDMILFGSNNDDSTVTLPDIGFDFYYNGINCRNKIYISGNSWVGFGQISEHLKINRRDTSYNKLYYSKEVENDKPIFRIRWEGNSTYNAWGRNDLLWELILYDDNVIVLVIEAIPNNGINSFDTKGSVTTLSLENNKSYVMFPTVELGKNYTIQEGSYKQTTARYLIDDGENGIKVWQDNSWIKVSDGPLTEDIMINYGSSILPADRTGLILTNPVLLFWTDDLDLSDSKIKTIGIPTPKIIKQNNDYLISAGIKNIIFSVSSSGNSIIKVACSTDSGEIWNSFYNGSWIEINLESLNVNGMTANVINSITETQWDNFIQDKQSIRFAYYIEKSSLEDQCSIKSIRLNYK